MGNKNIYNDKTQDYIIQDIKKNPKNLIKFYKEILKNYSNIPEYYNNFEYNIKKKLFNIIISLNETSKKDFYLSLSCIFGAFFFDSCGSHCEFLSKSNENHFFIYEKEKSNQLFKNGQITDDSEMAISRAFAIMDSKILYTLNSDNIFYYYGLWFKTEPLDIGHTTQNGLKLFDEKKMFLNVSDEDNKIFTNEIINNIYNINKNSLANGGLMKISTLIVWFYYVNNSYVKKIFKKNLNENYNEKNENEIKNEIKNEFLILYEKIYYEVKKDIIITHPNEENIVVCSIFTFLTLSVMCENTGNQTIKYVGVLLDNEVFEKDGTSKFVKKLIIDTIFDFQKPDFYFKRYFSNINKKMGHYVHALKLSLYYLFQIDTMLKNSPKNKIFLRIIEQICDFGGDTDTNGAIVGTLIGPIIGYKNFYDKNNEIEKNLFETFLKFFDKNRILYTSSLMYYYVEFLEKKCKDIDKTNYKNNKDNKVLKMMLKLLFLKE